MPPYQRSVGNLIRVRNQENSSSVISGRWPNTGAHTLFARFQFRVHPRLIYIYSSRGLVSFAYNQPYPNYFPPYISPIFITSRLRGEANTTFSLPVSYYYLFVVSKTSMQKDYYPRLLSCLIINDNYTLEILMMIKEISRLYSSCL